MNSKFFFLILLLPILLVEKAFCTGQRIEISENMKTCLIDEDCAFVSRGGGCGCSSGYLDVVNRKLISQIRDFTKVCLDAMSTHQTCFLSQIRCMNKTCNIELVPENEGWQWIFRNKNFVQAKNRIQRYTSKKLLNEDIDIYLNGILDEDILRFLFENGVDPNFHSQKGPSLLWQYSRGVGLSKYIPLLESYGAKLKPYEEFLKLIEDKNLSALKKELLKPEITKLVKTRDQNLYGPLGPYYRYPHPLNFAAEASSAEVVSLLVQSGAEVNGRQGSQDESTLESAALAGNIETFKALIKLRANTKRKSLKIFYNSFKHKLNEPIRNELMKVVNSI